MNWEEDEDADPLVLVADLLRRDEPLVGLGRRHADVDHGGVRLVHRDVTEQILRVPDWATTANPASSSSRAIPRAAAPEVVREHDAQRGGARAGRAGPKSPPNPGSSSWKIRSAPAGPAGSRSRGPRKVQWGVSAVAAASEAVICPPW